MFRSMYIVIKDGQHKQHSLGSFFVHFIRPRLWTITCTDVSAVKRERKKISVHTYLSSKYDPWWRICWEIPGSPYCEMISKNENCMFCAFIRTITSHILLFTLWKIRLVDTLTRLNFADTHIIVPRKTWWKIVKIMVAVTFPFVTFIKREFCHTIIKAAFSF